MGAVKKKFVIDAGHGGVDSGATGVVDGKRHYEKHLCWDFATRLKVRLLELSGDALDVVVVPHTLDTNSPNRARFRNRVAYAKGADLFLSIHWNAGPASAYGTEAWFKAGSGPGKAWAARIGKAVSVKMSDHFRGVFADNTNRHGSLGILTGHKCPAALLEVAFITHASEVRKYLVNGDDVINAAAAAVLAELKL